MPATQPSPPASTAAKPTSAPRGRKRDPHRDAIILDSTVAVLGEHGYEGMTIDLVAAHAGMARATVYRRWPTKAELAVEAVSHLSQGDASLEHLPDTGTLRGDLVAMIRPFDDDQQQVRIQAVLALLAVANTDDRLARAAHTSGTGPWVDVIRLLIQRAIDRGEYSPPPDLANLSEVIPMLCIARAAQRMPITRDYSIALIDQVLLPALRGS